MALYFRGGVWDSTSTDWLKLQGATTAVNTGPWTLSFWMWLQHCPINGDKYFGYGMVGCSCEDNSGTYGTAGGWHLGVWNVYGYQLSLRGAGGYLSYCWHEASTAGQAAYGQNYLKLGRWHHVVMVGLYTGGEHKGYYIIDGAHVPTYSPSYGRNFAYQFVEVTDFYVGKPGVRLNNSGIRPLTGGLAEVAFWNTNLSESKCLALRGMQDLREVGGSALQFYMPLRAENPLALYGAQSGSITVSKNGNPMPMPHPNQEQNNFRSIQTLTTLGQGAVSTMKLPHAFAGLGTKLGQRQPFNCGAENHAAW